MGVTLDEPLDENDFRQVSYPAKWEDWETKQRLTLGGTNEKMQ